MNKIISRLALWKKFAILGIFGFALVSIPFLMYVYESDKDTTAARNEAQAIEPIRLELSLLQLLQQHRGLSALALAGNEEAQQKRQTKAAEVSRALAAFDEHLVKKTMPEKLAKIGKTISYRWHPLNDKVAGKAITVADSFAEHTALIGDLFKIKSLLLEYYGLSFDPEADTYYLIDATLVQSPMLAEMFGRLRAKGAGLLNQKTASTEEKMAIIALIDKANDRYQGLNDSLANAAENNGNLKTLLAAPGKIALNTANDSMSLAQKEIVKADQLQFSSSEYVQHLTAAIDAQFSLNEVALKELERMLKARSERLFNRAMMLSLSVLALSLLAIVVGTMITRGLLRQLGGEPAYVADVVERISAGELSIDIALSKGDRASLLFAVMSMRNSLSSIVNEIRTGTETMVTATSEIAAGNLDLSTRTEDQVSSLEETAASMGKLTSTVTQNAENARQANQLAVSASQVADKGSDVVSKVVSTMNEINASSVKITEIISVIEGISFQTNILALNAAVEAARAGEQGRGFAVVATEVRNLAHRSANAAKEIKSLIENSIEKVGAGCSLVGEAGNTMDEISSSVRRVTDIMAEISAASHEQSQGIRQVNQAITQMDDAVQQNAALVEQAAAASQSLESQAYHLEEVVSVFKLDLAVTKPQIKIISSGPEILRSVNAASSPARLFPKLIRH